jgi:hypothetical protein
MKKTEIIAFQATIIHRYDEIISIIKNEENTYCQAVKIYRLGFQIQNLKRKLKKAEKSSLKKSQNPD